MKRNALRTYTAALSTVGTSAGHVEGADDMEHLLLKGIHICLLRAVKLIAVKYALAAAAGRTDISAGIAADAFAKLTLEISKTLLRRHCLDPLYLCETLLILRILRLADPLIIDLMLLALADMAAAKHGIRVCAGLFSIDAVSNFNVSAASSKEAPSTFRIPRIPMDRIFSISSFPLQPTPMMYAFSRSTRCSLKQLIEAVGITRL